MGFSTLPGFVTPGTFPQPNFYIPDNPAMIAQALESGDTTLLALCGYLEMLQAQLGNGRLSGGEVTAGEELSALVAPFSAIVGSAVGSDAVTWVPGLTDGADNYLWLRQDGGFSLSLTSDEPTDANRGQALLWSIVTTVAGVVSAIAHTPTDFVDALRSSAGVSVQSISLVLNNGTDALAVGQYVDTIVEYACTIQQVTLLADQSGSAVIDLRKCTYANFDDSTHPVSGDSICASAKPTLSAAVKSKDSTLTGWSLALSAGDILRAYVVSASTLTQVTLSLKIARA